MARIPKQHANQTELVQAVIDAKRLKVTTGYTEAAITWLTEHYPMSPPSATRALEHEAFQYVAMYPDGHPRLETLTAELKERRRRGKITQGIRRQVIERDGDQCQHYRQATTLVSTTRTQQRTERSTAYTSRHSHPSREVH